MIDKEKIAYSEQLSNPTTIQKGNSEIIVNDEGTVTITAEQVNIKGIVIS